MVKLIYGLLIILMSIASTSCKTAEQQQMEHYQNMKPIEWELACET